MSKLAKHPKETPPTPDPVESMGISPAVLAKRKRFKNSWCPMPNIEFDPFSDEHNPKTITYKAIVKAASVIKESIPKTPLMKSRCCKEFGMELYYKVETFHATGSFHERGALNALSALKAEQKETGVITASLGNWAMALSYQAYKLDIDLTVVLPVNTLLATVDKCRRYRANVVLHGKNLEECKLHAFSLLRKMDTRPLPVYINGYDHPHVIAGSGTIGLEIMDQLPNTDVILVPVGGGGLISGIAAAVKQIKPEVLIYGVELAKNCCFFKAMEHERPYKTTVEPDLAPTLGVPIAGYNAFHTAKSLIDKMVLANDDWVARGIMHLVEEEKLAVEGAGATSLGALLAVPDILPELKSKNVVCILSGGNIDVVILPRCIERAKALEGRLIKLTVTLPADSEGLKLKVLSIIRNVGGNVVYLDVEHDWLEYHIFFTIRLNLIIETRSLEHACTLKRVMEKLFPFMCEFLKDPFSPIPTCICFPAKRAFNQ